MVWMSSVSSHESLDVTLAYLKGKDAESEEAQEHSAWRCTAGRTRQSESHRRDAARLQAHVHHRVATGWPGCAQGDGAGRSQPIEGTMRYLTPEGEVLRKRMEAIWVAYGAGDSQGISVRVQTFPVHTE